LANPDTRLAGPPEFPEVDPANSISDKSPDGELARLTTWLRPHQRESDDLGLAETALDPVFARINHSGAGQA
jgi:hypothetical protein